MTIALAAEASTGAVGSVSICRVTPDLFVTPVSDSQQRLKVIAWRINQLQHSQFTRRVRHAWTVSIPYTATVSYFGYPA